MTKGNDPLKDARKRFKKQVEDMSATGKHRAAQVGRQAVAEDKEQGYQTRRKVIVGCIVIILIVIVSAILVWFVTSGTRVPVEVISTPIS